jgi:hypothetical protein
MRLLANLITQSNEHVLSISSNRNIDASEHYKTARNSINFYYCRVKVKNIKTNKIERDIPLSYEQLESRNKMVKLFDRFFEL